LYIPGVFADETRPPVSIDQAYSNMADFGRFTQEWSAGKLNVATTVTPLIILPHTLTWYHNNKAVVDPGTHHQQMAQAGALAPGYDPSQDDCVITRINGHAGMIGTSFRRGQQSDSDFGGDERNQSRVRSRIGTRACPLVGHLGLDALGFPPVRCGSL
jgi:hypothetical protein